MSMENKLEDAALEMESQRLVGEELRQGRAIEEGRKGREGGERVLQAPWGL